MTEPQPAQPLDLAPIQEAVTDLADRVARPNRFPPDSESWWDSKGWKSGTANAIKRLQTQALIDEVEGLRAELEHERKRVEYWQDSRDSYAAENKKLIADKKNLRAELATTRAATFTEAARVLEHTGRDDDAVNLLDNIADGITANTQDGSPR